MKVQIACISLAAVAAASVSANAADWSGARSYKDIPPAIAVPAPVPIPDDIKDDWYVGVSTGAVMTHSGSVDSIGSPLEVREAGELSNNMIFGISFGRYITPSLRAEVSFDYQRPTTLTRGHVEVYTDTRSARGADVSVTTPTSPPTTPPTTTTVVLPSFDTNHYIVTREDEVELSRNTGMIGLIYDFKNSSRFTPYVGAGIGVSVRKMQRTAHEVAQCDYTTNTLITTYPVDSCVINTVELPANYEASASSKVVRVDLAATLQAGFGYEIHEGIIWDTGYQMMWEGASIAIDAPTLSGVSRVSVGDSIQHQVRTGLRFAVN